MTTVATTTAVTATASANQRKSDRTQNGVLWMVFWNGTSTTSASIESRYSTDDGATWNEGDHFGFVGTGTTYTPDVSFFIDPDDYAHVAYIDRDDGSLDYKRGTPNAARTGWTWTIRKTVVALAGFQYPDLIAHREGTGWKVHIVGSIEDGSVDRVVYYPMTIASDGTLTLGTAALIGGSYSNTNHKFPSIDLNHTGDGKTIAGSTPHLYAAWSAGATGSGKGIRFRKATYSSGSWTWGTERGLDDDNYAHSGLLSLVFDGTRVVVAYIRSSDTRKQNIRERDAADTATTSRTPTGLSSDAATALSVTYDGDENIHLWAVDSNDDDVYRAVFDRSAGTWDGSRTKVALADATADSLSLKRGYAGALIEAVYTDGTASPYDVTYSSISLFTAATIKAYTGSAFEEKPLKRWDGTEWVEVESVALKRYDGAGWVTA